jgi:hypothetical protein
MNKFEWITQHCLGFHRTCNLWRTSVSAFTNSTDTHIFCNCLWMFVTDFFLPQEIHQRPLFHTHHTTPPFWSPLRTCEKTYCSQYRMSKRDIHNLQQRKLQSFPVVLHAVGGGDAKSFGQLSCLLELPKQCRKSKAVWISLTFLTFVPLRTRVRNRSGSRNRRPRDLCNVKYHK